MIRSQAYATKQDWSWLKAKWCRYTWQVDLRARHRESVPAQVWDATRDAGNEIENVEKKAIQDSYNDPSFLALLFRRDLCTTYIS